MNNTDDLYNRWLAQRDLDDAVKAEPVSIAGDADAVGYVSIGHIDQTIKAPLLGGVGPTQDNAKSGKYPVIRQEKDGVGIIFDTDYQLTPMKGRNAT